VYQTLAGNPRLRLADTATHGPAERLQELVTPAQMHTRFRQLQTICARLGVPMTAVVVRLDGIERLRDELGGSAALTAFVAGADRIGAFMREGDEFGRWSDDELAIFCPGAEPAAVREFADAIAAALEQVRVRHDLQHDVQITLPLRATVQLVTDLGAEPESAEDEAPPPERHLHVA
jgi:GGDEF domain-containing protein